MRKNDPKREKFIDKLLGEMTLEQKVGQCFTYMWSGHMVTPSVVQAIEKLHAGSLRLQPFCLAGKRLKYYDFDAAGTGYAYPQGYEPIAENLFIGGTLAVTQPGEYAASLNKLQEIATNRPGNIPMNFSIDQEGDFSRDFPYGGINLFPSAMGLTATGDPKLVYEVNKAVALQLSAMGITCIHSPVCDVNLQPQNPEIGIRSFGDDAQVAAEYALAAMKGLQDGGLITTGKHFPGRGDSKTDAHHNVPVLDVPRKRLDEIELVPYRLLIKNGLDCIMIAHNVYTAIDPDELATVSPKVIQGLLREELGFEGVITTDAIAMGALMKKYPLPVACAKALQAGCDMVLNKMETPFRDQGFLETLKFVREGKISEEALDTKVRRILRMKYDRGLFAKPQVDTKKADRWIKDKSVIRLARESARKAAMILKNEGNILPLKDGAKIAVFEQFAPEKTLGLDVKMHRLSFTEAMYGHSMEIIAADTEFCASESDEALVMAVVEKVDTVVMTNHYFRQEPKNNSDLVKKVVAKGKKVILVTNTPYEFSVVPGVAAVICTFSSTPESMRVAADIIFGKEKPEGRWPLKNYRF
jgi:beta-N-acetylhexosaminidase